MEPISVEEAQRRLPELLKRVAAGERIAIDDHGQSVEIVAAQDDLEPGSPPQLRRSRLWELREEMTLGDTSIKSLIEEGRE